MTTILQVACFNVSLRNGANTSFPKKNINVKYNIFLQVKYLIRQEPSYTLQILKSSIKQKEKQCFPV